MIRCIQASLFLIALSGPVVAQSARDLAETATRVLDEAVTAFSVAEDAREQIEALTLSVRAFETGLAALREGMRLIDQEKRAIEARLSDRDQQLGRVLLLLQKVSRSAPGSVAAHPGTAVESLRAGTLASSLVPTLQEESSGIAQELADLSALQDIQSASIVRLREGLSEVTLAREALFRAISNRTGAPVGGSTDEATLQALLETSDTLTAFANTFAVNETESVIAEDTWDLPVVGDLSGGFEEGKANGWTFETAPAALVTAPTSASVRFAGTADTLGSLMILEPTPGILVILQGYEQSFVKTDMFVSEGEPIAVMGGLRPPEQENLNESTILGGQFDAETLYIEVRKGQDPVDPSTLFGPT